MEKGAQEMPKEEFCGVDDLKVIIPYREYERMVNSARKIERILAYAKQMERQYDALHMMYRECLNKLAEINKYL